MNREIIFRGLDSKKAWCTGYLLIEGKHHYIAHFCNGTLKMFEVDPATIGQFTGLLDKNGTRIWEGDIVLGMGVLDEELREPVRYEYHEFAPFNYMDCEEVVGNIHEPRVENDGE